MPLVPLRRVCRAAGLVNRNRSCGYFLKLQFGCIFGCKSKQWAMTELSNPRRQQQTRVLSSAPGLVDEMLVRNNASSVEYEAANLVSLAVTFNEDRDFARRTTTLRPSIRERVPTLAAPLSQLIWLEKCSTLGSMSARNAIPSGLRMHAQPR